MAYLTTSDGAEWARAAQYVRVSTDTQIYSITNQIAAISAYAATKNILIVRTYTDSARSGLTFEGRPALRQLVTDVLTGQTDFRLILVYDVSRWGRFQDIDESAHYEYICRNAGVSIEYCAELFENNNSLSSSLLKGVKRVMAGEYSRELSARVFMGQARIAAKGFHVGTPPKLGLRRCLVDEFGVRKMELKPGQRKALQTERTILIPGPTDEVETVRKIYNLVIDRKMTCKQVVNELNNAGSTTPTGRPWYTNAVLGILRNEKYAGTNVYGRTTKKLSNKTKRTPKDKWIRAPYSFDPIISPARFNAAQREINSHNSPYTENLLLDYLTAAWCVHGTLSSTILKSKVGPTPGTFKARLGGLIRAYNKLGFKNPFIGNRLKNDVMCRAICHEIANKVRWYGATAEPMSDNRLFINGELIIGVLTGRTPPSGVRNNQNKWQFGITGKRRTDIVVVARVGHTSTRPFDYFIIPLLFLPLRTKMMISGFNYEHLAHFRSDNLDPLYQICARQMVESTGG